MTQKYRDYLGGPEWKVTRTKFLAYCRKLRREYCWLCGDAHRKNFRVHHITYARIFKERMEDLTLLCDHCHGKFHAETEVIKTGTALKSNMSEVHSRIGQFHNINRGKYIDSSEFWEAMTVYYSTNPRIVRLLDSVKSNPDNYADIIDSIGKMLMKAFLKSSNKYGAFKARRLIEESRKIK